MNRDLNQLGYSFVKALRVDDVEYSVWYRSKRGASVGRFFYSESDLVNFVSTFKRDAVIKMENKLHGRVWKDNKRWNWYIGDPAPPAKEEGEG